MYESYNTVFTMYPEGNKDVSGFETVVLVERDKKGYSRVCI